MAAQYHPGQEVEYFSGSMNQWILARVVRQGAAPGTYDLDCKDGVAMDRIRLPAVTSGGQPSFGQPSQSSGSRSLGGPLGLGDGESCFYKSSTHGWITAQAVRFRPEDGAYDLDVKGQVPPQNIFCLRAGEVVDYHSASSNSWIPAKVVRPCADPGVFDLDCKDAVHISRIRPPSDGAASRPQAPYGGKGAGRGPYPGGRLSVLPEDSAYADPHAEMMRQQKLEQLRQAVRSDDPNAIKGRLESTSALALQGEEDLDLAGHKLWALEARPAAQADLRRAVANGDRQALEAAVEAAVAAGVGVQELEAARQTLKRLSAARLWRYDPSDAHHIDARAGPQIDGKRVRVKFHPGDVFFASQEKKGPDGVLYLELADGRGWLFDHKPGVGVMCRRHSVTEADSPGAYRIIHDQTAVTPTEALEGDATSKLAYGAVVSVVQVVNKTGSNRIRGRLENPLGWISLLDTEGGKRWAVKTRERGGHER